MGHPDLAVVTGAFGYTGGYVARRLIDQGVRVRTLTRRPAGRNALGGLVEEARLDFSDPDGLCRSMEGAGVLYNTYGIRFAHGQMTFDRAVENTGTLFEAAVGAGVGRIVHFSVTNVSKGSELPYFRGKGQVEEMLMGLGVPYAVIRPTLVYGDGDLLLNNMAWALRRFPVFLVHGRGDYPVQPVYAEDVAAQAVEAGSQSENSIADAAGPETFSFGGTASAAGLRDGSQQPVGARAPIGGPRPDPTGRPAEARRCAHPRRGGRTHGWTAHVRGRADRRDKAERLAQRQRGQPGETLRVRVAAQLPVALAGAQR